MMLSAMNTIRMLLPVTDFHSGDRNCMFLDNRVAQRQIGSYENIRQKAANMRKNPQTSANAKFVPFYFYMGVGLRILVAVFVQDFAVSYIVPHECCGSRMSRSVSCSTLVKACAMAIPSDNGDVRTSTRSKIEVSHLN